MNTPNNTPGEVEAAVRKHGFGAQFDRAIEDLDGDREVLAFMFLAGLSAYAGVTRATVAKLNAKIDACREGSLW